MNEILVTLLLLLGINLGIKYNKISQTNPDRIEVNLLRGSICGYKDLKHIAPLSIDFTKTFECTNFYQVEIGSTLIGF